MRLIYILIFLLLSSPAWSAIYYIDYLGGADTNNGTATGTPFKHCPGDAAATNTAASTTLAAGDKVIFKGGVTYTHTGGGISTSWGGSGDADTARIIYDGDSGTYVSRWGSGTDKAVIDGNKTATHLFIAVSGKSYITINNLELKGLVGSSANYAIIYDNGVGNANYWKITNCTIHDAGHDGYTGETWDGNVWGVGIQSTSSNWLIDSNTFYDCYSKGIYLHVSASYNTISNNTFNGSKISWGIAIATVSGTMTGNSVHHNTMNDIGASYPNPGPHNNGIMSFVQGGAGAVNGLKIYNNKWVDTTPTVKTGIITFQLNTTGSSAADWEIYNNVCINVGGGGFINASVNGYTMTNWKIYNNSVYSTYNSAGLYFMRILDSSSSGTVNGLYIKNNTYKGAYLCMLLGYYSGNSGNWSNIEVDYNLYVTTYATDGWYAFGSRKTWTQWKALGYDAHGLNLDPSYTSTSNLYPSSAESPLVDAGVDLGASYNTDYLGTSRPQGSSWDIGAYEFESGDDVTAPTLSTKTIASSGTSITLGFSETVSVGAGGNAGWSISPSGGAATLTYASGSGSSSLVYTISRTILQGETATLSYTQPGNGIEDSAGNDLSSLSDSIVTNNSTQIIPTGTISGIGTGTGSMSIGTGTGSISF